jgi:serine/threonine protein kinase
VRELSTGRDLALKIIYKSIVEHHRKENAGAERDVALADVRHPNIVPFLRVMDEPRWWYIAMPLYRRDLFGLLSDAKKLPEPMAKAVAAQLVSALAYLHARGIVHGDVKVENILIDTDTGGAIKLIDFGSAYLNAKDTWATTHPGTLVCAAQHHAMQCNASNPIQSNPI